MEMRGAARAPRRLCSTRSRWNAVISGQICSNGKPLKKQGCSRILVHVRSSKTLFTVERYGVLETFKKLASDPGHRIALLGDTVELGMSHDYVALLARQQGITLRNFQNESQAVAWVTDRRQPGDRRHQSEQTMGAPLERRQSQRRTPPHGRLTRP